MFFSRFQPTLLLAIAGLSFGAHSAAAAEPLPYKVGVASVDITPDHPIRLNGFGFRRAESEGTYQKIFARALALEDGSGQVALLITVDMLGIPTDIFDEVARRLAKVGVEKD